MSKQYIYIARHGETVGNASDTVQTADEQLSLLGHEQAKLLAERVKTLKFSRLLASDMIRAQQTAEYIAGVTTLPIETITDIREFQNPARFQTLPRKDVNFLEHIQTRINSFAEDNWDYKDSDEESFREFTARADRARELLSSTTDNFFMVTHGHFLRFFTARILCGQRFSPKIWHSFGHRMSLSNAGISVFVRDLADGEWYLEQWNDTAHFAD